MTRRLWLHIGAHRTATTSCQVVFSEIAKYGQSHFYYPTVGRDPEKSMFGHNALVNAATGEIDNRYLVELLEEVGSVGSGGAPILLSAEEFWRLRPDRVRAQFIDFDVGIICFKREFFSWLISIWSISSVETCLGSPYDFILYSINDILQCGRSGDVSFFDYPNRIRKWRRSFGDDAVYEFEFPASDPYLKILGLVTNMVMPPEWAELDVRVNESMALDDILGLINSRDGLGLKMSAVSGDDLLARVANLERAAGMSFPMVERYLRHLSVA